MDINKEPLLKLTQAARLVPPEGTHVNTLRRWINKGLKGVRLESVAIGGNIFTSEEALHRFLAEVNARRGERLTQSPPASTPASRRHAKKLLDEVLG